MSFFLVPPPTRYDLNFRIARIPVRVHPLFWLLTIFLGLSSGSIVQMLIWVVVVFISILIHELGHSLAMRLFGQDSSILLYMMGGLAIPQSSRWGGRGIDDSSQQIVISLAGPFAGFLLALLVIATVMLLGGTVSINWLLGFIPVPSAFLLSGGFIVNLIISTLLWVNVFWGLINLVPVYPLDGGQVARQLFIKMDPWDGVRKSLWLSTIAGAIVALVGLVLWRSMWIGFLFGILAFQSYQMMQGRSGGIF